MIKASNGLRKEQGPVQIGEGVYWVGYSDPHFGAYCNPYLIIEGNEAVVIDSGSRPDFPTVMMKILQTGVAPSAIVALIYQHYDPDLCGSIPHFESIIARDDLKVIGDASDMMFLRHYSVASPLYSLEQLGHEFRFATGRRLKFVNTPYCHTSGSYMTFDEKTKILFTGDLFGSYSDKWELFMNLKPLCKSCDDYEHCSMDGRHCPIPDIVRFHRKIFPSTKSLKLALKRISEIPFTIIAPQHGSIANAMDAEVILAKLSALKDVGIDGIVQS